MRGGVTGQLISSERAAAVRGLRFGCLAISALMVITAFVRTANGQHRTSTQTGAPVRFEIAAQPLAPALDAYAATAGLEVLYDSELAAGRRSTAVRGVLMPDVALRVLLEGTGLTVFYTDNAFAIVPVPSNRRGNAPSNGLVRSDHMPYLALVQAAIERAFCQQAETTPGQYRAALRFRLGTSGEVLSPQLLGSTGDRDRDRKIGELLGQLSIEQPPPPGMPQPVTMIVSPRAPAQSGDCRIKPRPSAQRVTQ